MSLSGIGAIPATQGVTSVDAAKASASGGGALPFSVGATSAGAYIAQGGGAPGEGSGGSIVKKMLAGGVVGAGLGFAASFIPGLSFIPHFKIVLPAAGAAIGALGGLALHLIGKRRQNLAMQAQAQAAQQQSMQPTPLPGGGVTLRMGAKGPAARKLQADLATLGLYKGPRTNTFDAATAAAVRRYEVMKGVVPTGQGSPDVRSAVAQDVQLLRQYA